ncbi:CHAT domain-containing protein [Nonomuraea helvata]|uniref:CHAT domain-containing protein n=1 Tax=Nonomuraea helvata TaxID=37484 RepID=A0ABV5SBK8_9ACTN
MIVKFEDIADDLVEWVYERSGGSPLKGVNILPFCDEHGMDLEATFGLLSYCMSRSLLADDYRSLAAPTANLTAEGIDRTEARRKRRTDPKLRVMAARTGLLNWLWLCKQNGMHMPVVSDFAQTPQAAFEGDRFRPEEIDRAAEYLHEAGLITGVSVAQARGPVRAETTKEGDYCAEQHGGDVSEYEQRGKAVLASRLVANAGDDSAAPEIIKILFLSANPEDTDQLRLDEEARAIDEALRQSEHRDRFDLRSHWAVRIGDLQRLLLRYRPDIVHFSGHGSSYSEILLQDDQGRSFPIAPDALSGLFSLLSKNVRCVVLNACYSERQAAGIAASVDCVVGMSDEVTDEAAILFAGAFYGALGAGETVQRAFHFGCNQVALYGLAGSGIPQLVGAADPSTVLFAR